MMQFSGPEYASEMKLIRMEDGEGAREEDRPDIYKSSWPGPTLVCNASKTYFYNNKKERKKKKEARLART